MPGWSGPCNIAHGYSAAEVLAGEAALEEKKQAEAIYIERAVHPATHPPPLSVQPLPPRSRKPPTLLARLPLSSLRRSLFCYLQIPCRRINPCARTLTYSMLRFSCVLATVALGVGVHAAATPRQDTDALSVLSGLNEQALQALQTEEDGARRASGNGCSIEMAGIRKDW